jgi:hypothetical protein
MLVVVYICLALTALALILREWIAVKQRRFYQDQLESMQTTVDNTISAHRQIAEELVVTRQLLLEKKVISETDLIRGHVKLQEHLRKEEAMRDVKKSIDEGKTEPESPEAGSVVVVPSTNNGNPTIH